MPPTLAEAAVARTVEAGSYGGRCSAPTSRADRRVRRLEIALGDVFTSIHPDVAELFVFFLISLPGWVVAAKLYGLYDRDEERTDHSTTDDVVGVFHLVTVGVWILFAGAWLTDSPIRPDEDRALLGPRDPVHHRRPRVGRGIVRRSASYVQNAVVVGGGHVGQLIARKYLLHPEYGIRLVGVVDDQPLEQRDELAGVELWRTDELLELVQERDIDRVVFAFSHDSHEQTLALIRGLRQLNVQIDLVPRLYEVLPPNVDVHSVEGLPLLSLRPVRISRSSRLVKRAIDLVGSSLLLLVTAPLFALFAWRIKHDSPGPVFFRQTRLGQDMKEFTALKFRTMTRPATTRASRIREVDHELQGGRRRERALQARAWRCGHQRRPLAAEDLARRAAAVAERPPRRHVARRSAPVHPVRDRRSSALTTSSGSSCPRASRASGR